MWGRGAVGCCCFRGGNTSAITRSVPLPNKVIGHMDICSTPSPSSSYAVPPTSLQPSATNENTNLIV